MFVCGCVQQCKRRASAEECRALVGCEVEEEENVWVGSCVCICERGSANDGLGRCDHVECKVVCSRKVDETVERSDVIFEAGVVAAYNEGKLNAHKPWVRTDQQEQGARYAIRWVYI